jgi:ElaB/YqjD/DUF883 family membrane-anchored ribosome-binding protein
MTMPRDAATASADVTPAETGDETTAGGARDQLRHVKDQVVDQARTSFRQARDSATTSLNDSRHQAADRIGGIANAVRSTGQQLRAENQAGVADLTDSLADQVDRLSSYLRDRDFGAVREDLEQFARRQPAVAVGVALAIGLLGARFIKSSQRTGRTSSRRDFGPADWDIDTRGGGSGRAGYVSDTYGTVGYGSGGYQAGEAGGGEPSGEQWGGGHAGA